MSSAAITQTSRRACGACGADSKTVVHRQNFVVPSGYPLPANYDVVVCDGCGFVYADPAATQIDYDHFYSDWSKYDDSATATGSGVSPYDAERLKTTAAHIARALPIRSATILDAGCATGGLLSALRDEGFTSVSGLDPSPRCAAACRERGFDAYIGSIASTPIPMPQFDCIVFSHVLEHVYDIPAFFAAARRLLKPGGFLYLETPDATRYADFLYAPFQEFNTEHINHFSPQSLQNTAQRFGFECGALEQKTLQTGADAWYPAVFGVFKDGAPPLSGTALTRDITLLAQIWTYIDKSSEQMCSIDSYLAMQLEGHQRAILWGAGQLAMKLLALPSISRVELVAIVDNNPTLRGKSLGGVNVVGPEDLSLKHTSVPIVIFTLLHNHEIEDQIRRLGLNNPVLTLLPNEQIAKVTAS